MEHDLCIGKDEVGCGEVCDALVTLLEKCGYEIPDGSTEIVEGEEPSVSMHKHVLRILEDFAKEIGLSGK